MAAESLKALMNSLVDYAGLFPPAKLPMPEAVRAFARHREGGHAWALSRFIVPAARLEEFSVASRPFMPRLPEGETSPPEPWSLSVLVDGRIEETLAIVDRFNQTHEDGTGEHKHAHNAVVDTLEIKVQTPETIELATDLLPEELYPFFEVPPDGDFRGFATALAGTGNGAKLRTGGVLAETFPPAERIADFLLAMHAADVPFKCTAGLHHPVRSMQPMTYEPGCASTTMHGFLNVFVGAVLLHALEIKRDTLLSVLTETKPDAFRFMDDGLYWRELKATTPAVAAARENFAICFGSCSFDDPINDLKKLGWL